MPPFDLRECLGTLLVLAIIAGTLVAAWAVLGLSSTPSGGCGGG
jgi:hypothetical protein